MFLPFFLITIISFTLSLLFTPLVRNLAIRWNLVDAPDNKRKVHKKPIPRVGGVAVAIAFFGSLFATNVVLRHQHAGLVAGLSTIYSIVPAAVLIFLIGLADDIFDLKARHKFAAQIVAAVIAVAAGVHIPGLAATGLAAAPGMIVSVMWLVLCTNAVNLIDGLDGLAGGISLLATITILIGSLATGNIGLTLVAAPLAAALLGFLIFNFNPASIFLGDSGSLLLGFLIGSFSLVWSGSATTTLGMMAPLLVLALPLLDVSLAIARRFLRGQPIFSADRAHVHHRLLARGLSHRGTVLTMYGAAAIAGGLSLCLAWASDLWALTVIGLFVVAALAGIQQLGYVEFAALRKVVFRGGLRSEITAQLAVQTLETGLEAAATADDCWATIQGGCEEFGFYATRMQLAGQLFSCPKEKSPLRAWAMRIPISKTDWIELSNTPGPVRYPTALVPFVNTMRDVLTDKSMCWMNRNDKTADYATGLYSTVVSTAN